VPPDQAPSAAQGRGKDPVPGLRLTIEEGRFGRSPWRR
jgi:hypothetical protein